MPETGSPAGNMQPELCAAYALSKIAMVISSRTQSERLERRRDRGRLVPTNVTMVKRAENKLLRSSKQTSEGKREQKQQ